MLYTKFSSGPAAQHKLQTGINKLTAAVSITLGAKGRLAVIKRIIQKPFSTKDGVTVAREFILPDDEEQAGVDLVRGAAEKTALQAGDGTTATIILTNALVNEGLKAIAAGANPVSLADGIKKAAILVTEYIKRTAIMISLSPPDSGGVDSVATAQEDGVVNSNHTNHTNQINHSPDYLTQVATIAANGDSQIGAIIASAYRQIGKDGICTLGEPLGTTTEIRLSQGLHINTGYTDMKYATNHQKMTAEYLNPVIVILENKITDPNHALLQGKILHEIVSKGRPLIFMCDGMDDTSGATLLQWKIRDKKPICVTKLPAGASTSSYGGELRKELLKDIAALTGATVIGTANGLKIAEATFQHAGEAKKVTVGKDFITFEAADGHEAAINTRAQTIREQVMVSVAEPSAFPLPHSELAQRLARLTSGIATIHPGATTELETRELHYRVEDAILATKSAIEEGIVVGGGICLLNAAIHLNTTAAGKVGDDNFVIDIMTHALRTPIIQLCANAGDDFSNIEVDIDIERLKIGSNAGYNAVTGQIEDLLTAGIVDAAKVPRCAILNAAGIAAQILLTQTLLIQDNPDIHNPT